jgi:hypothetical protein
LQIFFTRGIYSNTSKAGTNETHYIQAILVLNLANQGGEQHIQHNLVILTLIRCIWQGRTTKSVQVKESLSKSVTSHEIIVVVGKKFKNSV